MITGIRYLDMDLNWVSFRNNGDGYRGTAFGGGFIPTDENFQLFINHQPISIYEATKLKPYGCMIIDDTVFLTVVDNLDISFMKCLEFEREESCTAVNMRGSITRVTPLPLRVDEKHIFASVIGESRFSTLADIITWALLSSKPKDTVFGGIRCFPLSFNGDDKLRLYTVDYAQQIQTYLVFKIKDMKQFVTNIAKVKFLRSNRFPEINETLNTLGFDESLGITVNGKAVLGRVHE